jgi:rhodanese-related sulfurtransferase
VEYAFSLPEEKFQAKYGINKPSKNTTFITSCKVGGRATKMRDKLNEMGYNMVKAYTGSLTEWIKMGGEVEK